MPSSVAWLDTTPEQQRLVRELVKLFSNPDSRDELGLGQIRDVFSNLFFPGTSVLQTRARYFLFVPWCYQRAAEKAGAGDFRPAAGEYERDLIGALATATSGSAETGVIGRDARRALRNLPSAIYWSGLEALGIVQQTGGPASLRGRVAQRAEANELADRIISDWHSEIPAVPKGFPREVPGGFALSGEEAEWLKERILATQPRSLFAACTALSADVLHDARGPWNIPVTDRPDLSRQLEHARQFSLAGQGLSLLYTVLVAEKYDADASLTRLGPDLQARHENRLRQWEDGASLDAVAAWDLEDFWQLVVHRNRRIDPSWRQLLRAWQAYASYGRDLVHDDNLRDLVAERERRKGTRSRLTNPAMLQTWAGGGDGAPAMYRLDYRWGNRSSDPPRHQRRVPPC